MAKNKKPSANPQRLALWQIGALCLIAGPLANMFLGLVMPVEPPYDAGERGQLFGRGLAALLFVIAGVVLIVLHFVRRGGKPRK